MVDNSPLFKKKEEKKVWVWMVGCFVSPKQQLDGLV